MRGRNLSERELTWVMEVVRLWRKASGSSRKAWTSTGAGSNAIRLPKSRTSCPS